eukprot:15061576-Heterocapsa_arctica.AAC.1
MHSVRSRPPSSALPRSPGFLAIVPLRAISEQFIDDARNSVPVSPPLASSSSARTAHARHNYASTFVSTVACDMLDPTIRLLRVLRMPCYRMLQAFPVFLVLSVAAWFTVTVNYVAAHPELL